MTAHAGHHVRRIAILAFCLILLHSPNVQTNPSVDGAKWTCLTLKSRKILYTWLVWYYQVHELWRPFKVPADFNTTDERWWLCDIHWELPDMYVVEFWNSPAPIFKHKFSYGCLCTHFIPFYQIELCRRYNLCIIMCAIVQICKKKIVLCVFFWGGALWHGNVTASTQVLFKLNLVLHVCWNRWCTKLVGLRDLGLSASARQKRQLRQ